MMELKCWNCGSNRLAIQQTLVVTTEVLNATFDEDSERLTITGGDGETESNSDDDQFICLGCGEIVLIDYLTIVLIDYLTREFAS